MAEASRTISGAGAEVLGAAAQNLLDLQERHPSMVLPGAESVGIITIEDVIEELLQQVHGVETKSSVFIRL